MSQSKWSKTDSIMFGVFYGVVGIAVMIAGIAQLIEACRSRPKVKVLVLGVSGRSESLAAKDRAKDNATGETE